MHVVVTGAAGFIGSHVCERLVARGDRVTGIDSTAGQVFLKILILLKSHNIAPVFCGLTEDAEKVLELAQVITPETLAISDLDLALKWVEERLLDEHDTQKHSMSELDLLGSASF